MRPDSVRLKRAHRFLIYVVLVVLFVTGVAWACFNYFVALPNELVSASKSWAMKIHGAAAMAILVLLGTLLNVHVKFAWRTGRNRINGAILLSVFGVLIVTGYGLYYAGGEKLRAWTSWIHLVIGVAVPIFLVIHILLGRGARAVVQRRKHHHSPAKAHMV
jgi:hypothetical protein